MVGWRLQVQRFPLQLIKRYKREFVLANAANLPVGLQSECDMKRSQGYWQGACGKG